MAQPQPLKPSWDLSFLTRLRTNEHTIMALLAVMVGLAGGGGAVLFRYLIGLFQALAYGGRGELLGILAAAPWYRKVWVPALGGMVVGPLVYFLAKEAKGHGVPEVMEAVALRSGLIRKRIVVIKILASAVCIGTGGSVGREGPIVQIGSAIGSALAQVLRLSPARMRTLVGCGAAAGIAATFNAPIAGSMFALEIVLGDFGLATFSPIVISSVVATAVSRHYLGNVPAFGVPAYELVSAWEFPLYVVLGLMCAAAAVSFSRLLYASEDAFDRIPVPGYAKALIGGLILGVAGLAFPQVLGVGYGGIDRALSGAYAGWLLLVLAAVKILATSITIGSGGSGGIFAPSLFLGVTIGGFFGSMAHQMFPAVTASAAAYAIVGMGAVVAGTTHGPLTAILILFEMTGNYKIILPLMITCIVSNLAARQLLKESIYTLKLIRKGIDLRQGREVNVLKSIRVGDVMSTQVEQVYEGTGLEELARVVSMSKNNSFPVVDAKNRLTGILSFYDYSEALFNDDLRGLVIAKDIATPEVVTVTTQDSLYDALEKITPRDFSILPVVAPDDASRLVGVLSRRDIIGAYDKAVLKKALNI